MRRSTSLSVSVPCLTPTNHILLSIVCTVKLFYIENDAEIFPVHYTWKVTEKGFKMAFMMTKLAIYNSCEINLEKLKKIAKNHC